jgi:hypothetical protein
VVVAGWGDGDKADALILCHGQFDTAKASAALKGLAKGAPENLKVHKEDALRIYEIVGSGPAPEGHRGSLSFGLGVLGPEGFHSPVPQLNMTGTLCFAVLDQSTLAIAADKKHLVAAAKRAADGKRPAVCKELRELVESADAGHSVWFAAVAPRAKKQNNREWETPVEAFVGSINLKDDVKLQMKIFARTHEGARQTSQAIDDVRTRLQGMVLLLAGSKSERSSLAGIPRAFKDSRQGRVVTLEAQIPAAVFEDLATMFTPAAPANPPSPTLSAEAQRPAE